MFDNHFHFPLHVLFLSVYFSKLSELTQSKVDILKMMMVTGHLILLARLCLPEDQRACRAPRISSRH
jgi:hypothetical protein